jgi:hypothetical protein
MLRDGCTRESTFQSGSESALFYSIDFDWDGDRFRRGQTCYSVSFELFTVQGGKSVSMRLSDVCLSVEFRLVIALFFFGQWGNRCSGSL